MCFSAEIDMSLQNLAKRFHATVAKDLYKEFADLSHKFTKDYKIPKDDGRIFPNYWAPVIVMDQGKRVLRPMRYRVRPRGTDKEIPSKYNLFNARRDSLESRATWKKLFMKNHGLFPFRSFYEWVENDAGKKVLLNFRPQERELMWAPCLWESWESKDHSMKIHSFALITDDPPAEVSAMGHDRCPIFLREDMIDTWLTPGGRSTKEMQEVLQRKEEVRYGHQWAA